MQEGRQGSSGDDGSKSALKTIFDDYIPEEGIVLYDPSPPSALRMVFLVTPVTKKMGGTLLGQIVGNGNTIRVIRRMGDSGVTVRDLSAAIRLLKGGVMPAGK